MWPKFSMAKRLLNFGGAFLSPFTSALRCISIRPARFVPWSDALRSERFSGSRLPIYWKEARRRGMHSRTRDLSDYFSGTKFGFAILLGAVKTMRNHLTASELEAQFGIVPPQSYRYVTLWFH